MKYNYILNLELFPDEDPDNPDFDLDDLEDDNPPADDKPPVDDKDWIVPGKYKTKEDMLKGMKKTEQYVKQLEMKNKELGKTPPPPVEEPAQTGKLSPYKEAAKALGITNDDMLIDPLTSNEKIHEYLSEKNKAETDLKLSQGIGSVRSTIIIKELKKMYPNFDIDKYEAKIGAIATKRYNNKHINADPIKVFGDIIEEFGGKKSKSGEPYSEAPTSGAGSSKTKTTEADAIRKRIKEAPGSSSDIFK